MHTKSIHFETRRAAAADRIATVDRGLANSPSDRPTLAPPSYLNFMAAAAGGGRERDYLFMLALPRVRHASADRCSGCGNRRCFSFEKFRDAACYLLVTIHFRNGSSEPRSSSFIKIPRPFGFAATRQDLARLDLRIS